MERTDDGGLRHKDDHVHLLKGILKCGVCGLAMTPYPSGKKTKDGTPYLYYACVNFTKDGSETTCPVRDATRPGLREPGEGRSLRPGQQARPFSRHASMPPTAKRSRR